MESIMVLRALDSHDPVAACIATGALPAGMILTAWEAMDRMKVEARLLPPYDSGTDPKAGAPSTFTGGEEQ